MHVLRLYNIGMHNCALVLYCLQTTKHKIIGMFLESSKILLTQVYRKFGLPQGPAKPTAGEPRTWESFHSFLCDAAKYLNVYPEIILGIS